MHEALKPIMHQEHPLALFIFAQYRMFDAAGGFVETLRGISADSDN